MTDANRAPQARMANAIRALAMDAVEAANSGHPGMPMGMADVATVLFGEVLKYDPADPHWPDRDRFILSAGHGSMLIYALLNLTGYARPTMDDIRAFRQIGSPCAGHPENFELAGVEVTTGPLGQGLAMAVGMALAERHLNATYGDALVDHNTWVIAGDGCLQEGVSHEAIGLAGHLKLARLNVLWDDNLISIDGPTSLSTSEDSIKRFEAAGWHTVAVDGHDTVAIRAAMDAALADSRPSLIACRTVIGRGAPNKGGTAATHGAALGAVEIAAAREYLGWEAPAFEIPEDAAALWLAAGARGRVAHDEWSMRLDAHPDKAEFLRRATGHLDALDGATATAVEIAAAQKPMATRKSSELALETYTALLPDLIGGSADLTGSNNTRTKATPKLDAANYGGRYLHYGIREFGMSAAMNGMALHGGVVPYGGTFLVFSDYARGAIRLSALQRARVIYVLTHDSIGLGEDGPTHQPIEHVMSLRMIPNLMVFRPADAIETAECWALALANANGPSVLALTRQNLAPLPRPDGASMLSARGAWRVHAAGADRRVVFVATGSEVGVALDAAKLLAADGIGADVVSMPSWSHFDAQDQGYRSDLIPADALIVSIEAGVTLGWERYTMVKGLRIGIDGWGVSCPGEVAMAHFGFTGGAVADKVRARLG